jgi:hypothetical protein
VVRASPTNTRDVYTIRVRVLTDPYLPIDKNVGLGSIGDTNRRGQHGRTCFDTGRQRGQSRACVLSQPSVIGRDTPGDRCSPLTGPPRLKELNSEMGQNLPQTAAPS